MADEPILDGTEPQPIPVPVRVQPKPVDDDSPIQMDGFDDDAPTQRRAFGGTAASATGAHTKTEFNRALNADGTGATRCKFFRSKISDGPLDHVEVLINEWADENEVEIKFVTQTIGVMEGKRAEPNLLIFVWY
jgi:hypothetical protein